MGQYRQGHENFVKEIKMANNLTSNVSTKVSKIIAQKFETDAVLVNTVDTQVIAGTAGVTNDTGDTVYLKRPTQYKAIETVDGDISGETKNSIGVGRIPAKVQNYITVAIEYSNLEEVTELNQLSEIIAPAADELLSRLELNIGKMLIENAGLTYGTPGTAVDSWDDVSGMGALQQAIGMPSSGPKYYVMNPFVNSKLSSAQTGLTAADSLVRTAWENSQISPSFAGMRVMSSNALNTYQAGSVADRDGTLSATPDATWAAHKDTMIQTLALTGLTISKTDAVRAGDVIEFTGVGALARSYTSILTRKAVIDGVTPSKWRCTVVTGGNTDGSGNVSITVTNAAIFGSSSGLDEQFTNISAPLTSGDTFTILGATDVVYQPNLAYNKNAFALSTLALPRLHATDTLFQTKQGLKCRVTKYSDGDKNLQKWRIDMLPVMGVVNPLFIAKAFGK